MNRPAALDIARAQEHSNGGYTIPSPSPPKSFPGRVWHALYTRNWRRAVIAVAVLNVLRFGVQFSLSSSANVNLTPHKNRLWQDRIVDLSEDQKALSATNLWSTFLLGFATCVSVFGVYCGISQRLRTVRLYVFLSFAAMISVWAVAFIDYTVFFSHQMDIRYECGSLGIAGKTHLKPFFANNDWPSNKPGAILSPYDASSSCFDAWKALSATQLPVLLFLRVLPSIFVALIPWAWYRQLIDPMHPHASPEVMGGGRSGGFAMGAYPAAAYSPLYQSAGQPQTQPHGGGGTMLSVRRVTRGNEFTIGNATATTTGGLTPGPPSYTHGHGGYGVHVGPESGSTVGGY